MSQIGQRICRLAEEAANATHPGDALRLLCKLRLELEDFERRQAARALTLGESFGAIARAMGMSRQSAHRRFRDLSPAGEGAEHPTPEARLVAQYAREECVALGDAGVRSEHMLLAVVRLGDGPAGAALDEAGVTLDDARAVARRLRGRATRPDDDGLELGTGRLLAHAALSAARVQRAGSVGVEHLLLGALEDDDGGAAATLRELGVPVHVVRARLEEQLAEAQLLLD